MAMFVFFYLVFPSTLLPDHVKVSAVNRGERKVRRADVLEIKITIRTDENNNEEIKITIGMDENNNEEIKMTIGTDENNNEEIKITIGMDENNNEDNDDGISVDKTIP